MRSLSIGRPIIYLQCIRRHFLPRPIPTAAARLSPMAITPITLGGGRRLRPFVSDTARRCPPKQLSPLFQLCAGWLVGLSILTWYSRRDSFARRISHLRVYLCVQWTEADGGCSWQWQRVITPSSESFRPLASRFKIYI